MTIAMLAQVWRAMYSKRLTAFFSLCSRVRVRDAAASGFRGEDTAGVLSLSSFGIAVGAGFAGGAEFAAGCWAISAILIQEALLLH